MDWPIDRRLYVVAYDSDRLSLDRQLLASRGVNMEAEEAMALEAVTRQQLVKTQ
jgi:hypothetical protein